MKTCWCTSKSWIGTVKKRIDRTINLRKATKQICVNFSSWCEVRCWITVILASSHRCFTAKSIQDMFTPR